MTEKLIFFGSAVAGLGLLSEGLVVTLEDINSGVEVVHLVFKLFQVNSAVFLLFRKLSFKGLDKLLHRLHVFPVVGGDVLLTNLSFNQVHKLVKSWICESLGSLVI